MSTFSFDDIVNDLELENICTMDKEDKTRYNEGD